MEHASDDKFIKKIYAERNQIESDLFYHSDSSWEKRPVECIAQALGRNYDGPVSMRYKERAGITFAIIFQLYRFLGRKKGVLRLIKAGPVATLRFFFHIL